MNSVKVLTSHFIKACASGNKRQRLMSMIIFGPEKARIPAMYALIGAKKCRGNLHMSDLKKKVSAVQK